MKCQAYVQSKVHSNLLRCHRGLKRDILKLLTLFESSDPFLTAIIVWGKNVEVMVVIKNL